MKVILSLLLFMLLSTSAKVHTSPEWVATIEIYYDENQEFTVYYRGNYHRCFAKYILDQMYMDCDSINYKSRLDTLLKIEEPLPEKIKTEKI